MLTLDYYLFGAINFITDIDYENSYSASSTMFINSLRNNSINNNYTKITNNDWHLNFKIIFKSETNSAIAKGHEDDSAKNYQINFNAIKWISSDLHVSNLYITIP